jgi:hypothetical protein
LLSKDVRMITNLQNIKNSLKKTYSDNEIINFIKEFEFVDKLIEEHLQSKASNARKTAKFLPRDPKAFRKFLMNLDEVKNTYDPYTNFFIREAKEKELTRKILPEKVRKAKNKEEKEYYQDMLDSLMLAEYQTEVSPLNIGTHVIKRNVFNYDLETLLRDENNYNRDPELYSEDVADDYILAKKRREAESKLIKTKIIYKLHTDSPLTKNEMAYLKQWNSQIRTSNFVDLETCMLPSSHSSLSLSSLSNNDISHLNALPLVDLSHLSEYALNDLVLELSHLLDSSTITSIQQEVFVENLKHQWDLPEDFSLSQARNKEIDLLLGEVEENCYRHAAEFEEHEIKGMRQMFTTNMHDTLFDKAWVGYLIDCFRLI